MTTHVEQSLTRRAKVWFTVMTTHVEQNVWHAEQKSDSVLWRHTPSKKYNSLLWRHTLNKKPDSLLWRHTPNKNLIHCYDDTHPTKVWFTVMMTHVEQKAWFTVMTTHTEQKSDSLLWRHTPSKGLMHCYDDTHLTKVWFTVMTTHTEQKSDSLLWRHTPSKKPLSLLWRHTPNKKSDSVLWRHTTNKSLIHCYDDIHRTKAWFTVMTTHTEQKPDSLLWRHTPSKSLFHFYENVKRISDSLLRQTSSKKTDWLLRQTSSKKTNSLLWRTSISGNRHWHKNNSKLKTISAESSLRKASLLKNKINGVVTNASKILN